MYASIVVAVGLASILLAIWLLWRAIPKPDGTPAAIIRRPWVEPFFPLLIMMLVMIGVALISSAF